MLSDGNDLARIQFWTTALSHSILSTLSQLPSLFMLSTHVKTSQLGQTISIAVALRVKERSFKDSHSDASNQSLAVFSQEKSAI
ncbi:hypothetical protein FGO68_gene15152 [Halteria grandinella]|uniref:Uncharacterized protein n=1 Tax=Halteria grandinella TaxID=5974 RepID=A0A8J8NY53_HALGN|nr:hypothetical protein FGO68_gene15152 [Halteria grandinella]